MARKVSEDRQAKGEDRDREGDGRGPLVGRRYGEGREDEAEEEAAGVAHEDAGGVEVEDEEADEGAAEACAQERWEVVAVHHGEGEEGGDADEADAAREAVEAIDEVHGVDDTDEPQDGHRIGEEAELELAAAEGVRDGLDAVVEEEHERGDGELNDQLLHRVGALDVVVDADARDEDAADVEADDLGDVAGQALAGAGVDEEEARDWREEGDDDGDAAEARDRRLVDLALAGSVVEASLERDLQHERRQRGGDGGAQEERYGEAGHDSRWHVDGRPGR